MMKQEHKQWVVVLAVLLLLTAILLVLPKTGREGDLPVNEENYIKLAGLDFGEMAQLSVSAGNSTITGYPVAKLLSELRAEGISTVTFISGDGVRIIAAMREIREKEVLLLAEQTGSKTEYRLIFPFDQFRNRWVKNIIALEID